ncbi:hypothetical protein [Paracidovorax oryzae]|uniref:hypothetical protein n=1 Tax=Paracidovorax oryzae TaxID=862720 RepID=UPI00047C6E77|nr:hypothetical protein [Paracidovorax oryzae]
MTPPHDEDPAWDAAWTWVQREFDRETFGEAERAALAAWLQADPLHRQRYEEAAQLWRLAGMVPRRTDDGDGHS